MLMEETMRQASTLAPQTQGPTITAGEILVEIMATTVGNGFLEPQTLIGPFPSGAPAIFIDQVARCGGTAGIIAAVGDDDFGRLNVERLRRDGVDVSAIATIPDRPTGSAFVRYRISPEFSVQANLNNLLDKKYYSQITGYGAYGDGRNGSLTFTWAF